jgi:hypothetical protein
MLPFMDRLDNQQSTLLRARAHTIVLLFRASLLCFVNFAFLEGGACRPNIQEVAFKVHALESAPAPEPIEPVRMTEPGVGVRKKT